MVIYTVIGFLLIVHIFISYWPNANKLNDKKYHVFMIVLFCGSYVLFFIYTVILFFTLNSHCGVEEINHTLLTLNFIWFMISWALTY